MGVPAYRYSVTDLSERPRATGRLKKSRTRALSVVSPMDVPVAFRSTHPPSWNGLLEALPEPTALLDGRGVIHHVNGLLLALTGYEQGELIGQDAKILVPLRLRKQLLRARRDRPRNATASIWSEPDLTVLRRDGQEVPVEVSRSPLALDEGSWVVVAIRDMTTQRANEQARADAELRFRVAFENNMAPMTFADANDRIIAINDAMCDMVGFTREELLGCDSTPFTYPDDVGITESTHQRLISGEVEQERYVKRYLRKDGRVIDVEVSRSPARDAEGNILYFVFSERDITEERALAAQLSHQALHDPLTGLANRALFEDRLAQAHGRVVRQGGIGAVLLIDLDDFKGVNDTHGHFVGDQLLTAIANRLELITRSADTLCRFGGDEFLYLAEGLVSPGEAEVLAERLIRVIAEPYNIAGSLIEQRASIGIVIWDATCNSFSETIQNVDAALYEAKRNVRGHHVVFTPTMHQRAVSRFALVQELRHAFNNGDLVMHYQPIADLTTSEVVGFEALMRWNHPERGWVPPTVFIPLAEQSDLIIELGSFALREAILEAAKWAPDDPNARRPYVTVNLSAHQFLDPGLVPTIKNLLRECSLPPAYLILEITESVALIDIAETMTVLDLLGTLGVGIALDDFGTGFSSLSYLAALSPRIIKIDQSFVRPVHDSTRNDTLLETIISLGQKLNMTMLAEGIETEGQFSRLRRLGCELGQGYLFSPAVPNNEVEAMVGQVFPS
jgi:diguanylate cyclase (GGDEF)-like protein/PAS domain S-box-containing protein